MNTDRLAQHLQQPDIQRMILGAYSGPFSLGVTADPKHAGQPAISVRIAGNDTSLIPDNITLDDQDVAVIARPNFNAPTPQ
jgi:hypothetical protein